MPIRVRRLFPERPLTKKDFRVGTLHVSLDWEAGTKPGQVRFTDRPNELIALARQDFSASLRIAEEEENMVGSLFVFSDEKVLHVGSVDACGAALYALLVYVIAEAGERALVGYLHATEENRLILQSLNLNVHEAESDGKSVPSCFFCTFLPSPVGSTVDRHEEGAL